MSTKPPIHLLYFALFIGVAAVSTSAIFVKLATAPASIVATYRLLFSVLLMAPFILTRQTGALRQISKRDWLFLWIAGVFLALHFILWFESLHYTSVASSVVLVSLQPLFSFIGGYLIFREQLTKKSGFSSVLAFGGSVIIGWGDFQIGGAALWGDFLALMGAGAVTAYWLIGQTLRQRIPVITYTFIVYGTSTISLYLYDMFCKIPLFPYSQKDLTLFLLLAIIPTLLGHSVFNWIIKWVNASTISISLLGEPVGAAILAYWVLHEKITIIQWIGGTIIIAGIYLYVSENRRISLESVNKNERGEMI
jgi:drug/metabolite transporter (DMT)-like permease